METPTLPKGAPTQIWWRHIRRKRGPISLYLGVKSTFRNLSKPFETECGGAHDALPDAKGLHYILNGLIYGIRPLTGNMKTCQLWSKYTEGAPDILEKPVIEHLDLPEVNRVERATCRKAWTNIQARPCHPDVVLLGGTTGNTRYYFLFSSDPSRVWKCKNHVSKRVYWVFKPC